MKIYFLAISISSFWKIPSFCSTNFFLGDVSKKIGHSFLNSYRHGKYNVMITWFVRVRPARWRKPKVEILWSRQSYQIRLSLKCNLGKFPLYRAVDKASEVSNSIEEISLKGTMLPIFSLLLVRSWWKFVDTCKIGKLGKLSCTFTPFLQRKSHSQKVGEKGFRGN